jgi:hypothetical protein
MRHAHETLRIALGDIVIEREAAGEERARQDADGSAAPHDVMIESRGN